MTYQLSIAEQPSAALSRILCELLTNSRNLLLTGGNSDAEKAIHETRKNMKRARAALRLLRPHTQPAVFTFWNHRLRDIGRTISETRDRRVVVLAVDKLLKSRDHDTRHARALTAFRNTLEDINRQFSESSAEALGTARMKIDELLKLMPVFPIVTKSHAGYKKGLRASRHATTRAMKKCGKNPSAESIHEVRKRVKDLLYQTQLLLSQETKALNSLDKLSNYLGDHHDLAMVAEKMHTFAQQGILPAEDTDLIGHLLTRNQGSLWKKARKLL
jgi:CHAD domain-containing protein